MTSREIARIDAVILALIGTGWSVAEFRRAQARDGYVPTIHARTRRHGELIRGLRAAGVRVWTGSGFAR